MSEEAATTADEVPVATRTKGLLLGALAFAALLSAFLGAGLVGPPPAAAQDGTFTIEIGDVVLDTANDEAVVEVRLVPGPEGVAALTVTVLPDESLLTITAATNRDTDFPCPIINGTVRFAGFEASGWNDPIVLCEITLTGSGANGTGSFTIDITNAVALAFDPSPLIGTLAGGSIQVGAVEATPSPTPTAEAAEPTPEPSATPTPSPTAAPSPTPTRAPEVAVVPTATPEASPTPETQASENESSETENSEADTSAAETPGSAVDDTETDPTVELDPDTTEDAATNDADSSEPASNAAGRGTRAPSESPTAAPETSDSDASDAPDDDGQMNDGQMNDGEMSAAGDDPDEGTDDIALSSPLIDGSTTNASTSGGSSGTAALAVVALPLLAIGAALGVAARKANRGDADGAPSQLR